MVLRSDQSYAVLTGGFETTETAPSSSSAREEYFQIRVLSPDPSASDLIPPTRLPDDIISGDKLRNLFESLPDGRYDIQYVLGDGKARSILTVDLRDGKPILPLDDVDGGPLRLRPILTEASGEEVPAPEGWRPEDRLPEEPEDEDVPREIDSEASDDHALRIERVDQSHVTHPRTPNLSASARLRERLLELETNHPVIEPNHRVPELKTGEPSR